MTSRQRWLGVVTLLLLAFWVTRLTALNAFPPFIDEAFHVNFARDARAGSLLDHAEEGRQFVIWGLLLFNTPANDSFWTARAVILLTVLPGVAAAIALGRMAGKLWGGIFAGLLYLFSGYHFFFERMALADPPSASLVIVAVYFAYRYQFRVRLSDAVLCGIALFLAIGAKISALPYLAIPVLAVLLIPRPRRVAIRWLAAALVPALGLTGGFIALLFWRGRNIFFYLQTGGSGRSLPETLLANLGNSFDTLQGYAGIIVALLLLIGVGILLARRQWFLPAVLILPYLVLSLGARQDSRHIIPPITLLLVCAAVAMAQMRLPKSLSFASLLGWGIVMGLPFVTAQPLDLPVTAGDRTEYMDSEGSGFAIPEAIALLEAQGAQRVIGIMANCLSLQTLAKNKLLVECPKLNPNGESIPTLMALLDANQDAYVVLEQVAYAPASAPGTIIATVDVRQPSLTIYAP